MKKGTVHCCCLAGQTEVEWNVDNTCECQYEKQSVYCSLQVIEAIIWAAFWQYFIIVLGCIKWRTARRDLGTVCCCTPSAQHTYMLIPMTSLQVHGTIVHCVHSHAECYYATQWWYSVVDNLSCFWEAVKIYQIVLCWKLWLTVFEVDYKWWER